MVKWASICRMVKRVSMNGMVKCVSVNRIVKWPQSEGWLNGLRAQQGPNDSPRMGQGPNKAQMNLLAASAASPASQPASPASPASQLVQSINDLNQTFPNIPRVALYVQIHFLYIYPYINEVLDAEHSYPTAPPIVYFLLLACLRASGGVSGLSLHWTTKHILRKTAHGVENGCPRIHDELKRMLFRHHFWHMASQ